MVVEVVSKEDLEIFRERLLGDLKQILSLQQAPQKTWLRGIEVRRLLKISSGTLQNLRVTGKLKPSKIGGIFFYHAGEIEHLLKDNR